MSAFDVVLPDPIPGKGRILTEISRFWFDRTRHLVPNHLSMQGGLDLATVVPDAAERGLIVDRAMVVRRLKALPVEAVVRGYLIGSGWKDYQRTGEICGISLPAGLKQADRLPAPIFTPSSKAPAGQHDENIGYEQVVDTIGADLADKVRTAALALYGFAAEHAAARGIIVADTKFEFGLDGNGILTLIDEALTPDSSRFWPMDTYRPGMSPPSFDKQIIRDYLETLTWNKRPPGPHLPADVIQRTSERYAMALKLLTA
jgi:phosphoribosylaminoimidazole-succinocarboxamide synthase